MQYARIVFGLPVEGPFDYIIPGELFRKIKPGFRVRVNFCNQKLIGYVIGITKKTAVKKLKTVTAVIDNLPVLDRQMLLLAKQVSDYYCCSWGQAIETALPAQLRAGKPIALIEDNAPLNRQRNADTLLIHDSGCSERWDIYINRIKEALENKRSVIFLCPDINSAVKTKELIADRLGVEPRILYRNQPKELQEWLAIRMGQTNIVIGTRSAIFAPLTNLGLVIIDEEQNSVYKQDQVPHYNARDVSFMRINIAGAELILGSSAPSLEMFSLARQNKIKYTQAPLKLPAQVKIVEPENLAYNPGQRIKLSKYLQDAIFDTLNSQGKILLFLNRKGFATLATCHTCGMAFKCPRCNVSLVYHFKENVLSCHYCGHKITPPDICPSCNAGYIRYSGIGIEKIESEISRIFPNAKAIKMQDQKENSISKADILISTQSIIGKGSYNFNLIGVLAIDNSLNRLDFRSGEKTFALLMEIANLTKEKIIIQTRLGKHHCFRALTNNDLNLFYAQELRERKELNFPPYSHLGLVKMRGKNKTKVKELSEALFKELCRNSPNRKMQIISVNPGQPEKLRGNFCWQITIKSDSARRITGFLKKELKNFRHSNIIITVDVDPI